MSKAEGEYVPSPRPNPRLRPEGAAYAERNRGTMERWFDYSEVTAAAEDNKKGSGDHNVAPAASTSDVSLEEGVTGGPPMSPPDSRGGGDEGMTDSQTDLLSQKASQLSLNSHRSTSEEAKEYAQRNRGTMDHIINNYGVASPTSPQAKEVPSAVDQATETPPVPATPPTESPRRSLHMESQGMTWDQHRPAPRIRAEGESIALKNSRDSMFGIMSSENPPSPQDSPARKSRQFQESSATPQAANQPRARPGEGRKNYERAHDQSEMAAILRGEGPDSSAAPPRNVRHLQRSELW